mmetsp:Transcript_7949/g.33446  ORF Transcript_7949/g.33446 Transcript_7949/m.33446 type:complete len:325 (-) Transcript_7949:290-1264(-)
MDSVTRARRTWAARQWVCSLLAMPKRERRTPAAEELGGTLASTHCQRLVSLWCRNAKRRRSRVWSSSSSSSCLGSEREPYRQSCCRRQASARGLRESTRSSRRPTTASPLLARPRSASKDSAVQSCPATSSLLTNDSKSVSTCRSSASESGGMSSSHRTSSAFLVTNLSRCCSKNSIWALAVAGWGLRETMDSITSLTASFGPVMATNLSKNTCFPSSPRTVLKWHSADARKALYWCVAATDTTGDSLAAALASRSRSSYLSAFPMHSPSCATSASPSCSPTVAMSSARASPTATVTSGILSPTLSTSKSSRVRRKRSPLSHCV